MFNVLFKFNLRGDIVSNRKERQHFVPVMYYQNFYSQIDDIENLFKDNNDRKIRFSLSVPRASYIADTFAKFTKTLSSKDNAEFFYRETNSMRTIKNVLQEDYNLGIVRYAENFDKFYKNTFEEKNLVHEMIAEFRYVLIMSKNSPLASLKNITYNDLKDYIEISHADPYVPSLSFAEVKKEELPDNSKRKIFLFERASQFELLAQNPECFMWVSPVPDELKERYSLVECACDENKRVYKDVLIHKKDYALSKTDKQFIEMLIEGKRNILK